MSQRNPDKRTDKTSKGFKIPVRKRSTVMRDFELVAGPPRGKNREEKPKS